MQLLEMHGDQEEIALVEVDTKGEEVEVDMIATEEEVEAVMIAMALVEDTIATVMEEIEEVMIATALVVGDIIVTAHLSRDQTADGRTTRFYKIVGSFAEVFLLF